MRVVSVDFFRFIFMLQICMWHMNRCFNLMYKGYIAVDFFFILSGFFIYRSSISSKSKGVLNYTIGKVERYYVPFIIMIIPTLLLTWDNNAFLRVLNDLLFISNTGVYGNGVNDTLWYLSVLVVGGGLIYSMLKHFRNISVSFILPLLILMIYTYIFTTNNGNLEFFGIEKMCYKPLVRGIAGMSLGVVLSCLVHVKSATLLKYTRILDIMCICSLIGWTYLVFSDNLYDRYALVCACIIILCCFVRTSLVNRLLTWKGWVFLGELSLEMYIVHWAIVRFLLNLRDVYLIPGPIILFLYLVVLVPSAYGLRLCSNKLVACLDNACTQQ